LNISKFKNNLQAIVLGDFLDIDNNEYFDNLIYSIAEKNNIPIISGFKLTHDIQKDTIPIGGAAVLNGDTITIKDYLLR
jgi:muramoyltetrapeptide carboxypeptidase LdcA involved in peptidoglycan recycling